MMQMIYSVLRYVPNPLREEFVNVGVLLSCPALAYQEVKVLPSFDQRLPRFAWLEGGDGQFLSHSVETWKAAVQSRGVLSWLEDKEAQVLDLRHFEQLAHLSVASNIRLSSPRITLGMDPAATLNALFEEYMGQVERPVRTGRTGRAEMRQYIRRQFAQQGLFSEHYVREDYALPLPASPKVDFGYQNHVTHCYQAIPLSGQEERVTGQVYTYTKIAHDLRTKSTAEVDRNAHFVALIDPPQALSHQAQALLEVLKSDGIEIHDYRDLGAIVASIEAHRREHNTV